MSSKAAGEASAAHTRLPEGPFLGRHAFQAHVTAAAEAAAREGWRELVWVDLQFLDWPLSSPAFLAAMQAWALGGGQRLTLLAGDYDGVALAHPLFMRWRQQWAHKLDCRRCAEVPGASVPSLWWSPRWGLERLERVTFGGVCLVQPAALLKARNTIDSLAQRATPAFAAYTLWL